MESPGKEERIKYEKIIKDYLLRNKEVYSVQDLSTTNITFKKLGGGMNKNYLIEVNTNGMKSKLFFRYFGEVIYGNFDRKKEAEILRKLGEDGYGPRLLEYDYQNEKGYFVLNHHDLYPVNILIKEDTDKIYLIDNEFACLSLIGFDIIWYLVMSLFKYYPKYEYFPDAMNYEKFYEIYKNYLESFIQTNLHWIREEAAEERQRYWEALKKEKYYCELLCIVNLYSFIIGIADLQFKEEFITKTSPPFFVNVLNRIQLFEFAYEKYKNILSGGDGGGGSDENLPNFYIK
ncbi:hypothetical protein PIROE2DRAFT_64455 [Piromyces sp. E2]|nr:hypothetical protein PIROE2DRAFT_64455 [Piromyces sp. E2]|eukprot:OUM58368.1 hypothetical protein PIROE2DRAFT_64455 [Piromyces sp. E2]